MPNLNGKHWTLYVLRLEQKKWYVGITSQTPEARFREHRSGRKSYWTEEYPPIEIADTRYLGDLNLEEARAYEEKVTRRYMREKGVNNVRGGSITETSDVIIRFGYIWDRFGWEAMTVIVFELLVIAYLLIDKYLIE